MFPLFCLLSEISKVLGLTGQDLDVPEDVFCQFIGNTNCPPPTLPTIKTTPTTAAAVNTTAVKITTAVVTTSPSTVATTAAPPPPLVIEVSSWDGMVPTFDLRATDVLPSKLTCHGIIAAGPAATALTAKDLESWSQRQLLNCIEVLGNIDWPREAKLDVWKLIVTKLVSKLTVDESNFALLLEHDFCFSIVIYMHCYKVEHLNFKFFS
jgi:hypothetical protein